MKHKIINRWFAATTILGSVIVSGAYLMMPTAAAQETRDGSPMWENDGARGRRGRASDFRRWRVMRLLDLTEEQRDQLRELRATQFEQTKDEREAFRGAEKQFHEAVKAFEDGNVGEDVVFLTSVLLAEARAEMAIAHSMSRGAFLEILTPEQQQKLGELRTEMKERRNERMERRKEFLKSPRDDGQARPGQVI